MSPDPPLLRVTESRLLQEAGDLTPNPFPMWEGEQSRWDNVCRGLSRETLACAAFEQARQMTAHLGLHLLIRD
jgi:hypothetical protein